VLYYCVIWLYSRKLGRNSRRKAYGRLLYEKLLETVNILLVCYHGGLVRQGSSVEIVYHLYTLNAQELSGVNVVDFRNNLAVENMFSMKTVQGNL